MQDETDEYLGYFVPSPAGIRQARKAAGLTQAQAGQVIGASRRAWQEWEAGRRNMPPAKMELFKLKTQEIVMARMYLVCEGGCIEAVDRAVIRGIPVTQSGYPMERTERTRELTGWPDKHVREWVTDAGNVYLVPEP